MGKKEDNSLKMLDMLLSKANGRNALTIKRGDIAKQMDVSLKTVDNWLRYLKGTDRITYKQGKNTSNKYIFND